MTKRVLGFLALLLAAATAAAQPPTPYTGPTPPLALRDLNGKMHRLRDYRGKVVMVQFWATYCPPCVKEMPSVERLKAQLSGKPFAVLAVNLGESKQRVRAFLRKTHVHFTVLLDTHGQALRRWRVYAVPSTFLIDRHGNIRYRVYGGQAWDKPPQTQLIARLLAEP